MLEIYEETFKTTQKSLYGIFIFCFFGALILDKFSWFEGAGGIMRGPPISSGFRQI